MENFCFDLFGFIEDLQGINQRQIVEIVREALDSLKTNEVRGNDVITEYIECYCENDFDEIEELTKEVEENCKMIHRTLKDKLKEYCKDYNICSICGSDVEYTKSDESSEYFGRCVGESNYEAHCTEGCF